MGDYTIDFYNSGNSHFNPKEEVPHYLGSNLASASSMGMAVNPMVADQLGELSKALNSGLVPVEIATMNMQTFETIPKAHFDEIRRKAALAEAQVSLHAPIQDTEASGFGQRGWEESQRVLTERKLKDVIEKAAIIDPNGNTPVTMHSGNTNFSTFEMKDGKKVTEQLVAVDRNTGQVIPIKGDTSYYAGRGKEGGVKLENLTPEEQLEMANNTQWQESLRKIEFSRESAKKSLNRIDPIFQGQYMDLLAGKKSFDNFSREEQEQVKQVFSAAEHIKQAELDLQSAFNKAYKAAKDDKDKEALDYLDKLSKNYSKQLQFDEKGNPTILSRAPSIQADAIFQMSQGLRALQPRFNVSIEEFAMKTPLKLLQMLHNTLMKNSEKELQLSQLKTYIKGLGFF